MLKDYIDKENIGICYKNYSIKKHTTFKIGGICSYYVEVNNSHSLIKLIKYLKKEKYRYFIIGNGSNLLIDDEYLDIVFISLKRLNKSLKLNEHLYLVDCGLKPQALGKKIIEDGYIDALPLVLIPGTIGGLVYMNASCFKQSMDHIVRGVICLNQEGKIIFLKDLKCGYRKTCFSENHLIILKVLLEFQNKKENSLELLNKYQEIKRNTQPVNTYTAGSMFINGINYQAWELIDKLGLRGFRINDAIISLKHTNFFVNLKNATFNEMLALIYYVKISVLINYQIDLKTEVKIITNNSIAYS